MISRMCRGNKISLTLFGASSPDYHPCHRPSGSEEEDFLNVFAIYSHGGHLGHVTLTIYINFHSPFPRMLHMKFGFDWPSGFREEDV